MRKKTQLFFLLLLISSINLSLSCMDNDLDLNDFDLKTLEKYEFEHIHTRDGNGGEQQQAISAHGIAIAIAQVPKEPKPLWKNTKPPKGRDVLYLLPHKITTLEYGGIALSPFFNMTNKMHIGASSLIDFSNINRENILDLIHIIKPDSEDRFTEEHLNELIDIFKGLNIQDRKAGVFIQGGFVKGPFSLQIQTSIHLAAKNFFLNSLSQQRSKEIFSLIDPEWAESQISNKEFYILKYGMGDTRIKAGINSLNISSLQVDTGFEFILPTSRLVSQPVSNITISPQTLVSEIAQLETVLPQILRYNIRDLLLQPPLGNGGHFGIGWYIESKIDILHKAAHIWLRMSYDNLLSREQKRLIMYKQTITSLTDAATANNQGIDQDTFSRQVISKILREFYLPSVFEVEDHPGGVINIIASINTKLFKKLSFSLGYDFLLQQKGCIKNIYNTEVSLQELNIEEAETPIQSQHKIFSEIMYSKPVKIFKIDTNLDIGLGGDITIKSNNLGYDWTAYLKFATSF